MEYIPNWIKSKLEGNSSSAINSIFKNLYLISSLEFMNIKTSNLVYLLNAFNNFNSLECIDLSLLSSIIGKNFSSLFSN